MHCSSKYVAAAVGGPVSSRVLVACVINNLCASINKILYLISLRYIGILMMSFVEGKE